MLLTLGKEMGFKKRNNSTLASCNTLGILIWIASKHRIIKNEYLVADALGMNIQQNTK